MNTLKSKITGRFFVITVFLIIIIAFCISGTVKARGDGIDKEKQQSLQALEREYRTQLKEMLIKEGYINSGITLTKVEDYRVSQEQSQLVRQYTVVIHHKRIRLLSNREQEQLRKRIEQISFDEQNSSVEVQL